MNKQDLKLKLSHHLFYEKKFKFFLFKILKFSLKIYYFDVKFFFLIQYSPNTYVQFQQIRSQMETLWYPLTILIKKTSEERKKIKLQWNWKKYRRPHLGGTLSPNLNKFQELLFFYENKTAKNLQAGGIFFHNFFCAEIINTKRWFRCWTHWCNKSCTTCSCLPSLNF